MAYCCSHTYTHIYVPVTNTFYLHGIYGALFTAMTHYSSHTHMHTCLSHTHTLDLHGIYGALFTAMTHYSSHTHTHTHTHMHTCLSHTHTLDLHGIYVRYIVGITLNVIQCGLHIMWSAIFRTGTPVSHGTQTRVHSTTCMLHRPGRYHSLHHGLCIDGFIVLFFNS